MIKKSNSLIFIFRRAFPGSRSIENLFMPIMQAINNRGAYPSAKIELPYLSKGFWPRIKNTLYLLKFNRKTVHITGDVYYAVLGAWFSKRIITYHDLSFLERSSGIKRKLLELFWVKWPVKFAHALTAVSEATKQELLKHVNVPSSKITVIPNFIDPIFKKRANHSFHTNCPILLQVGTDFNKNLQNLIPALNGICCQLWIVGRLSASEKMLLAQHQIVYKNHIDLKPSELYLLYQKADILLFCSVAEGFGLPILEAQSSGLPVITGNLSSMPEVAGKAAFFVNPYDIQSIRKGIIELIQNESLRNNLINLGFANIRRFQFENIVWQYEQLYRRLEKNENSVN